MSVTIDHHRFAVLAPDLVRLEYAPDGRFVDVPSTAVVNRRWEQTDFNKEQDGAWLCIETAQMKLRFAVGAASFDANNLSIQWQDADGEHTWRPGEPDPTNLGAIAGDMTHFCMDAWMKTTNVHDPAGLPGPLSGKGCFLLDDSHTAVWNEALQWFKPRGRPGSQDWYFFVYGRNYATMLSRLAQLLGPVPMIPRFWLGAWYSSKASYSGEQYRMIVERFREEELPLDVILLDRGTCGKYLYGGYDFDHEQLPDPQAFFAAMKQRGTPQLRCGGRGMTSGELKRVRLSSADPARPDIDIRYIVIRYSDQSNLCAATPRGVGGRRRRVRDDFGRPDADLASVRGYSTVLYRNAISWTGRCLRGDAGRRRQDWHAGAGTGDGQNLFDVDPAARGHYIVLRYRAYKCRAGSAPRDPGEARPGTIRCDPRCGNPVAVRRCHPARRDSQLCNRSIARPRSPAVHRGLTCLGADWLAFSA